MTERSTGGRAADRPLCPAAGACNPGPWLREPQARPPSSRTWPITARPTRPITEVGLGEAMLQTVERTNAGSLLGSDAIDGEARAHITRLEAGVSPGLVADAEAVARKPWRCCGLCAGCRLLALSLRIWTPKDAAWTHGSCRAWGRTAELCMAAQKQCVHCQNCVQAAATKLWMKAKSERGQDGELALSTSLAAARRGTICGRALEAHHSLTHPFPPPCPYQHRTRLQNRVTALCRI